MGALDRIIGLAATPRNEGSRASEHTAPATTTAADAEPAGAHEEAPRRDGGLGKPEVSGDAAPIGSHPANQRVRREAQPEQPVARARAERPENADAPQPMRAAKPPPVLPGQAPARPPRVHAPITPSDARSSGKPPADERAPEAEGGRNPIPPAERIILHTERLTRERVIERTVVERLLAPEKSAPPRTEPKPREQPIHSLVAQKPPPKAEPTQAPSRSPTAGQPPEVFARQRPQGVEVGEALEPPKRRAERRALARAEMPSPIHARPTQAAAPRELVQPNEPRTSTNAAPRTMPEPKGPAAPTPYPVNRKPTPAPDTPRAPAGSAPRVPAAQTEARAPERLPPRAPSAPRIHISIGRVEIGKKLETPALVRLSVGGPRGHQIDPGLPFGSADGGRG